MTRLLPGSILVLGSVVACSAPDRAFTSDDGSSTADASSTGASPTGATGPGQGGGGGGGEGETGGGGVAPVSSSSQGGGAPGDCGNGTVDAGEDCDEDSALCDGCRLACPSGWFQIGASCFAVALNDVEQYDAFTADSKCGALAVGATGHRAHAATPATPEELGSLATRCPNNGCWLGFYAFGPPGERAFTSASTDEVLMDDPPWAAKSPGDELCLKLLLTQDGAAQLADQPCSGLGYFACELEPGYGDVETCDDGDVDEAEECDGDDAIACVDCDRRCPSGWVEDPRTHACLVPLEALATWSEAALLCTDAGGRLATPDEVADARVAAAIADGAWLGLEAMGIVLPPEPSWISGEPFDYEAGMYPLPADPTDVSNGVLVAGEIAWDLPDAPHDALCELLDPDG